MIDSRIERANGHVRVSTGHLVTEFRDGDGLSAANQVACLHGSLLDLQGDKELLRQRLAAAEARSMATEYEELRSIIDGGSESMTHEDAVQDLKDRDTERDELQRKLAAAEARVSELTKQLALRLRAENCDKEELLAECIENRQRLAAAEALLLEACAHKSGSSNAYCGSWVSTG